MQQTIVGSVPGRVRACACALLLIATVISGCAVNPATGESQLALVSESQEVQMGRSGAEQVRNSIGLYSDPALQQYVAAIGAQLASKSERPDLPWSFAVADDDVVNAFALPGGYIFVTRGILAHFNSEAELAAVLGHEIGHVTARHSVEQISRAQLAQIGMTVGSILYSPIRQFSNVIGQGVSLLFLKYGRDAEREADRLGLKYMLQSNYKPSAALDVFAMLARQSQGTGQRSLPAWLSTHPSPQDRHAELSRITANLPVEARGRREARNAYLRRLDGVLYGPDPRQGFFKDNLFIQPELGFKFALPSAWQKQNLPQAVAARSKDGGGAFQLTLAPAANTSSAAQQFMSQQGLKAGRVENRTINGFPATIGSFQAQTQQGVVAGLVAFIQAHSRVYQLVGYSPAQAFANYQSTFVQMIGSFSSITNRERQLAKPMRVKLIQAPGGASIATLAQRYRAAIPVEKLALLNGVSVSAALPAGQLVKWVVQ